MSVISTPSISPVEIIRLSPVDKSSLISHVLIKVCYVGEEPNRNGSIITKEVASKMAPTLRGCPIVGFYNEATQDFEQHNQAIEIGETVKFKELTRPYGFVDLNADVWFQDYVDDGVVHTYLVTEGYLWTGQYPEANRVVAWGNNQSMELDPETLQGTWTSNDNSDIQFFIINEAIISKLCILGENCEPCFEGASISKFSLDQDFNQRLYSLMKEVQKLKGGELSLMDEKLKELEGENSAPVAEEPAATPADDNPNTEFAAQEPQAAEPVEPAAEEPVEEQHEDNTVQFNLDDFQKLQESYSSLETKFNELQEKYNSMETNYNELLQFKQTKDKEEKQAMIDSFYMLSDEDKKDVQDNIDKYSVDEIEAKLSVICVHNKVNLSDTKEEEKNPDTSFSLLDTSTQEQEEIVPAWVSALRKGKNNDK